MYDEIIITKSDFSIKIDLFESNFEDDPFGFKSRNSSKKIEATLEYDIVDGKFKYLEISKIYDVKDLTKFYNFIHSLKEISLFKYERVYHALKAFGGVENET